MNKFQQLEKYAKVFCELGFDCIQAMHFPTSSFFDSRIALELSINGVAGCWLVFDDNVDFDLIYSQEGFEAQWLDRLVVGLS